MCIPLTQYNELRRAKLARKKRIAVFGYPSKTLRIMLRTALRNADVDVRTVRIDMIHDESGVKAGIIVSSTTLFRPPVDTLHNLPITYNFEHC